MRFQQLLSLSLLLNIAFAINLTISGTPAQGQALTLSWNGVSPWTLQILTTTSTTVPFTLHETFGPITVTNGIWNVDVAPGTFVDVVIQDATGSTGSQIVSITGSAAATNTAVSTTSRSSQSVLSQSSATPTTTSSASAATTTPAAVTKPSNVAISTPNASPTQAKSNSSSSAAATSSTSAPVAPNQLNASSTTHPGAVAGAVIGVVLGLLLLGAIIWFLYRRHHYRVSRYEEDNEKANFNGGPRRTLSRGSRIDQERVNWTPDQPHLTPMGRNGKDYLSAQREKNDSPLSAINRFGEFLTEKWHINRSPAMNLAPSPYPVETLPAVQSSVLDLAQKPATTDLPLYASELAAPRSSVDENGRTDSPFHDRYSVHGKNSLDSQDPEMSLGYGPSASGHLVLSPPPRPSRPERPAALNLGGVVTPSSSPAPTAAASQQGPTPSGSHSRKTSSVVSAAASTASSKGRERQTNWTLPNPNTSRYPAFTPSIHVKSPSTVSIASTSRTSEMAELGVVTGRQIYPLAVTNKGSAPRHPSLGQRQQPVPTFPSTGGSKAPARRAPIGPRAKPEASPSPVAPTFDSPLAPPRRLGKLDVPSTPTSPDLSAFPTPPTTVISPSHTKADSTSSTGSSSSGGHTILAAIAHSMTRRSEDTIPPPVPEKPTGFKASAPSPIITNGLGLTYMHSTRGLSPIAASPAITPAPSSALPSSTIGTPHSPYITNPSAALKRDTSAKTTTSATERMNSVLRREILDGARKAAYAGSKTPSTPKLLPDSYSNYRPPVVKEQTSPLPSSFSPTFSSPLKAAAAQEGDVPRVALAESWGGATYDPLASGRHISLASAASGRRLSDVTNGDAEWKELERQLNWHPDAAHIMPHAQ